MSVREKLIVIGNGMAGIACLEKILASAPDRFEISVYGDETYPNYNRIQLSPVLAGQMDWDEIVLNPTSWYTDAGIALHLGCRIEQINLAAREVVDARGARAPFDKLLIATGSSAVILPIPGNDKEGVVVFRTIDDCKAMIEASHHFKRAAVIGGGLLGLEAARGLKNLGMDVTVVHLMPWLMERQLDERGGMYLAQSIRRQGIEVLLSRQTQEILGNGRVTGLRFADGNVLECDFVVMAAGIRPNVEPARSAGIACNRGILVDDYLQTSAPGIYAVGECAEHRGVCYGLVAPLYEQGRTLAAHLTGQPTDAYSGSVLSTKLKVSGIDVFSVGDPGEADDADALRVEDSGLGVYKKAVLRDGRLVSAVLIGDISQASTLERLVRSGAELNGQRESLLTRPGCGSGKSPEEEGQEVLNLPGDTIICGCNGVAKGAIVEAIHSQKLKTRKAVAACTNASRSCGGCGPQIDALIRLIHGAQAEAPDHSRRPICDCTNHSRDEVVAAIRAQNLHSITEVFRALHWKGEGCGVCRPAINYYLLMCWPGKTEDDQRSRFVNERVHANIQRDGTYSVVPRIYGGVTTPDELMRIAQVAQKYNVPMVKITGGQRIDLLGVKKEQLPAIWEDLGMPSGFAYAKAIRTVKTCVGSDFCRFGTRDSIGLGIRIEKTFENLWTPAKVKMAVNGCPRNCAESLIKDVGLIAVDKAWEIYVGGNGGVQVRVAELLTSVESDDDAIDMIGAFLQLYREEANHGDRTSHWCERVGIEYVRKRVVHDHDSRARLLQAMRQALENRVDPWKDRARKFRDGDTEVVREYAALTAGPASACV